ncbi:putative bifunctional diguanylate cyclase/phosphodiesterase [Massilia sp. GCM10023247]|uniref:putative bifunctional diguanylate cyclase/phosphodiesterase n=1 Tax=Massilia sp. GCM10023247 TaxID=3252643 RepID=UPI00361D50FF
MSGDNTLDECRLRSLDAYQAWGSDVQADLDRLVRLAAHACAVPMAALSFVGRDGERCACAVGLDPARLAQHAPWGRQVVASRRELVIPEARRAQQQASGQASPDTRFYAGVPVETPDGFILGTLAVMDRIPRTLAPEQFEALRTLAAQVMAQLALHRQLREAGPGSELRFRQLADALPYIVWSATAEGVIDYANMSVVDYGGLPNADRIAEQWIALLHPDDVAHTMAAWVRSVKTGEVFSCEYRLLRAADCRYRWHLAKGMPIRAGSGAIVKWYGTTMDIHDMKLAHEEIGRLAFYDTLTRLPNRQLLIDRLGHALTTHARRGRIGAVLLIDLDNFKTINDTIGHDKGDLLLDLVGQRLVASVSERDTVARLGGDEFVIVLEDLGFSEDAAAGKAALVARRVLDALKGSFKLAGHERHITPSMGLTLFGGGAHGTNELLKRADLAMYQAKAAGRNTLCFFDPKIQAAAVARAGLESELRHALQRNEFLLHYQPQLDSEGRVTGIEALLRWQNPVRGLVSPAEFIPLAEDTGLILPLGRWVLEQACIKLARMAQDPSTGHVSVAVNVSALQFRQPGFVADVLAVLAQTDADPHCLKIELTETLLLEDVESAVEKIVLLQERGVCLVLDDFGTGYSSLSYLKRLPLHQIKIDQSFVRNLLSDPRDLAIVNTILALGQALGIGVIAEGVETLEQRELLARCGCRHFQGYLFSRPLPEEALGLYLQRERVR